MIDSNNLSDEQLNQLAAQKLAEKQAQPAQDFSNMSDEQLNQMAAQRLAEKSQTQAIQTQSLFPSDPKAQAELENNPEASLGFINRSKFALEPNQTNKEALLKQQFPGNVYKGNNGEFFINQNGQMRPVNANGISTADFADFAGALPETIPQAIGTGLGGIGAVAETAGTGGAGIVAAAPTIAAGRFAGGVAGSALRQALSSAVGTPQEAGVMERTNNAIMSGAANVAGGYVADKAAPYISKAFQGAKNLLKPVGSAVSDAGAAVGDTIKATIPGAEKASDVIGTTLNSTKNAIDALSKSFSLKEAPDAKDLLQIAQKHGINEDLLPQAVRYGRSSVVSRAERSTAEGPFGEKLLNKFNEAHGQVSNAIYSTIDNISPNRPKTAIEAGNFLKESIDNVGKNLLDSEAVTYQSAVDNFPGLKLSPGAQVKLDSNLNGLEKYAKGRLVRGIGSQKSEAKSILDAVESIRNNNGSLKHLKESMDNIGQEVFVKNNANRDPIDTEAMKDLYFKMRGYFVDTVKDSYGEEAGNSLVKNNEVVSKYLSDKKVFGNILDNKNANPEDIFKAIVSNGGSKRIETLKTMIPSEQLQPLKASFLESIVKKNPEGLVSFKNTINELERRKNVITTLFEPNEIKDFLDVLKLGKGMGESTLSSSGTGASNAFQSAAKSVKGAIASETNLELLKQKAAKANLPGADKFSRSYINRNSYGAVVSEKGAKAVENATRPAIDYNKYYGSTDKKENGRSPSTKFVRKNP